MASIDIENASVSYYLRNRARGSGDFKRGSVGGAVLRRGSHIEIAALRGIDLHLKDGDRVGLIGLNGSGKSTLLKLCSGALGVQSGSIRIEGRVSPQFSLGAGLKPPLSGRNNAHLKCLYMGIPQSRIADRVDEVKELSGLGDFFELPVSSYSAGMRSRLVMSMLRLVRGEILIMDEWIGAADPTARAVVTSLQRNLMDAASVVVLASHSERVLRDWISQLVWLEQGEIRAIGPIDDVYAEYERWLAARES